MSSKDICKDYGFRTGSRRQRKGESRDEFVARIRKTASNVIVKCRGNIHVVALVYELPLDVMESIVLTNKNLASAAAKARSLALAEETGDKAGKAEVVKALRGKGVDIRERDDRLRRHNWPQGDAEKETAIREALCISLVENEGDVAETSSCLNVPISEINRMLDAYDDVQAGYQDGLRVQARKAESQAFKQAQAGNVQVLKMVMTNILSDQWSERQQVDVRRVGFAPPDDKEAEEVSIFKLVKGDDNA